MSRCNLTWSARGIAQATALGPSRSVHWLQEQLPRAAALANRGGGPASRRRDCHSDAPPSAL